MQSLEVSGAVRPIYGSLGVKLLMKFFYKSRNLAQDKDRLRPFVNAAMKVQVP